MKLFSSKVTRLTVVGPLALVYIALHRADYSMAALWFCIALLWAGLVFKQRHKLDLSNEKILQGQSFFGLLYSWEFSFSYVSLGSRSASCGYLDYHSRYTLVFVPKPYQR